MPEPDPAFVLARVAHVRMPLSDASPAIVDIRPDCPDDGRVLRLAVNARTAEALLTAWRERPRSTCWRGWLHVLVAVVGQATANASRRLVIRLVPAADGDLAVLLSVADADLCCSVDTPLSLADGLLACLRLRVPLAVESTLFTPFEPLGRARGRVGARQGAVLAVPSRV
jgi:hypothetical protein